MKTTQKQSFIIICDNHLTPKYGVLRFWHQLGSPGGVTQLMSLDPGPVASCKVHFNPQIWRCKAPLLSVEGRVPLVGFS